MFESPRAYHSFQRLTGNHPNHWSPTGVQSTFLSDSVVWDGWFVPCQDKPYRLPHLGGWEDGRLVSLISCPFTSEGKGQVFSNPYIERREGRSGGDEARSSSRGEHATPERSIAGQVPKGQRSDHRPGTQTRRRREDRSTTAHARGIIRSSEPGPNSSGRRLHTPSHKGSFCATNEKRPDPYATPLILRDKNRLALGS